MQQLVKLAETNFPVIVQVYGMAFFLLGFAIYVQARLSSRMLLAKHLKWLAAFGFIHGLAEWGLLFIPMQQQVMQASTIGLLWLAEVMMWAVSYLVLLIFAIRLVSDTYQLGRSLHGVPPILFGLWLMLFIVIPIKQQPIARSWLENANIWSRYLLGLPGTSLTTLGLWIQRDEICQIAGKKTSAHVAIAAAGFLAYAFLGAVVVPPGNFFPANLINTEVFKEVTGFPVYLFRGLAAILVTYGIVGVLNSFILENQQRELEAQKLLSVQQERLRIARDLHDGAIQSFYAVSLQLQRLKLLYGSLGNIQADLEAVLQKINAAIGELRSFASNLNELQEITLEKMLASLAAEYRCTAALDVRLSVSGDRRWEPEAAVAREICLIVREGLSNAVRHGGADRVELLYSRSEKGCEIALVDNGRGFNVEETLLKSKGHGLENMRQRCQQIGGQFVIASEPGKGTTVKIVRHQEAKAS